MQRREVSLADGRVLGIRKAHPADAPELLAYIEQTSAQTDFFTFGPGEFDLSEAEERHYLGAVLDSPNQVFLLALVDGAIVGTANFDAPRRPRVRHSGEIGMSVHRDFWRMGVGSALLDTLIAWAKATGIVTKLNLKVRTDNDRAIALYRRKGFALEGTIRNDMKLGDHYYDHHCMGLMLDVPGPKLSRRTIESNR